MKNYIDLRSDTVTLPSDEMMAIMASAHVGDDVYGEDPTVNELQEYTANLLGKESAIYLPSGSMSNQIAIAVHTKTGDEIICEEDAHIFKYETAAPSIISRVQVKPVNSTNSIMNLESIENAIRTDEYYFPVTSLICLENTHNAKGGRIAPIEYIHNVAKIAKNNNCGFHLDGARLWNASVATGISPKDYVKDFDTVSVCLSKGLGAPVGSVLVGRKDLIAKALKIRKILGGGMRQAGIIASAGLFAIKNNITRLADDHDNAKDFAHFIAKSDAITIDINSVETNMVFFKLKPEINPQEFIAKCLENNIRISLAGKMTVRAVFHLNISKVDTRYACEVISNILNNLYK